MSEALKSFVSTQRSLLARLEEFSRTPGYEQLLAILRERSFEDPET